mgnify:CR=1 FL=1|jgi:hypothetical protein|tara:strand:- start:465 stop:1289 length:825 start_codon:yes stop_codon:yes gene_type:complete
MDYHALQQKLFEIDPADPAEDIRKLTEMASGKASVGSEDLTVNHLEESVSDIPEGTMPVDKDYSISDFAKLAGVQLNEGEKFDNFKKTIKTGAKAAKAAVKSGASSFKTGAKAGYKDPHKLSPAFKAAKDEYDKAKEPKVPTAKPKPKTSKDYKDEYKAQQGQKESLNFDQDSLIEAISQELDEILPAIAGMAARGLAAKAVGGAVDKLTANKKNKQKPIKARDPNAQYMNDLRKSGAAGGHKDKTKTIPRKQKHKDTNESIKSQLWAALNSKK